MSNQEFSSNRVPDLPQSKITNLATDLANKADDSDITALDARVDSLELGSPAVLSGGTKVQSGISGPGVGISGVVTFPIAFTTSPVVTIGSQYAGSGLTKVINLLSVTTAGFSWECHNDSGTPTSADNVHWIAIGN